MLLRDENMLNLGLQFKSFFDLEESKKSILVSLIDFSFFINIFFYF